MITTAKMERGTIFLPGPERHSAPGLGASEETKEF
jgi:hypothetical protein